MILEPFAGPGGASERAPLRGRYERRGNMGDDKAVVEFFASLDGEGDE